MKLITMIRNSFTCATELLTDKRLIYSIFRKFNKTLLASVKPSSIIKKSQITLPFTLLKAGNCYEFGSLFRRKFLFQEPLRNIFKNKDLHSSRRFSTGYGWPRLTKICSIFLIEQLLPEPCVRSVVVHCCICIGIAPKPSIMTRPYQTKQTKNVK